MTYTIDAAEIRRAWSLFIGEGQATELRALNCSIDGDRYSGTYSGYFNNVDAFVESCQRITKASSVYYVPNPVNPALLARSYNRARIIRDRQPLTTDKDIVRRRWLLIDVDAIRPVDVSSTEEERRAAQQVIAACDYELWERGFPAGVFCDSGNGSHLLIPIDRPADDKFCETLLKWLAKRCNSDAAKVDTAVGNAARIWKLPGTLACKGDHCPEIGREWRMARITQATNGHTHARL